MSKDNWSRIADGIQFRDTPGHGFVVLNAVRMDEMREEYPMLLDEENLHGNPSQFEEDCEWARVFCAFWRELDPNNVMGAVVEKNEVEELLGIVPPETQVHILGASSPRVSLSMHISALRLGPII